ncbi:MAG: hypothetical protein ABIR33_04765 [Pyrinomonadaceae bacterium]
MKRNQIFGWLMAAAALMASSTGYAQGRDGTAVMWESVNIKRQNL